MWFQDDAFMNWRPVSWLCLLRLLGTNLPQWCFLCFRYQISGALGPHWKKWQGSWWPGQGGRRGSPVDLWWLRLSLTIMTKSYQYLIRWHWIPGVELPAFHLHEPFISYNTPTTRQDLIPLGQLHCKICFEFHFYTEIKLDGIDVICRIFLCV